eukprot:TRINITY_DN5859_c0_g2_i2.p1 TRINITY_DN5859_c0_g2~~TRINITY_DN5859_c0_g2_i2.p1  ORF type:complete len:140 (-),score=36.58 TRINITY_DN5859_c0_g2_i2:21-440(-)
MTSIFLRLLEYYQGILFLTTNRTCEFDEAVFSRVSLAVHYPALSKATRRQVWANLLEAAGLDTRATGVDLDRLSEHQINGRAIRTAVRLSQELARANQRQVDGSFIDETLSVVLTGYSKLPDSVEDGGLPPTHSTSLYS